jgi:hypothetical protein
MKKNILKAFVVVSCLACATSAFAVVTITTGGTSIGGGLFRPSTSVTVKATASAADYAATSQHGSSTSSNGGKQYGTQSQASVITSATALDSAGPTAPAGGGTAVSTLPTSPAFQ